MEPSQRRLSILTKIEAALTVFVGVLAVITIFWHDWIEALTGWDPDQHNGTFEIYIIIGLALIAVVLGLVTRVSWKRDRARGLAPT
jgi:undecaprenyl pyrophosphate phosphatase UppP